MHTILLYLQKTFTRFFAMSLVCALLIAALYTDIAILKNGLTEISITEITQEAILFIITLLFLVLAFREKQNKGFYVLAAGFFATMLTRELDELFDLIQHGFWFYPAMLISISAITYAALNQESTGNGMKSFVNHKHFISVCNGLVIVLVFSRLFGMTSLWQQALGDDYLRVVKNVVEEGTELLGYEFLLVGVLGYYWSRTRELSRSSEHSRQKKYSHEARELHPT